MNFSSSSGTLDSKAIIPKDQQSWRSHCFPSLTLSQRIKVRNRVEISIQWGRVVLFIPLDLVGSLSDRDYSDPAFSSFTTIDVCPRHKSRLCEFKEWNRRNLRIPH